MALEANECGTSCVLSALDVSPDKVAVIMPAAGRGRRFERDENKLFALLDGKPIWLQTVLRLRSNQRVGPIVMPISAADESSFRDGYDDQLQQLDVQLVTGGKERIDSVQCGLQVLTDWPDDGLVAIHDAARPLVRSADLDQVFDKAALCGAAILAVPVTATVKRSSDGGLSCRTVDRSELSLAATPQVFRLALLRQAYQRHRGRPATDDAQLVARSGHDVALVHGASDNLKVTLPTDLVIAEAILKIQNETP